MVIIGAGGLAKELLTLLDMNGSTKNLFFFDDVTQNIPTLLYGKFPVIRSWDALACHFADTSSGFTVGIGGTTKRKVISAKAIAIGGTHCSIISKFAVIGKFGNELAAGAIIFPYAMVTADVSVGEGLLVNKAVTISHDVKIGHYCEISPGARLLGRVTLGDQVEVGANAVVLPGVTVGSGSRIGAGAVVTKDVPEGVTVVGVPAKPLFLKK